MPPPSNKIVVDRRPDGLTLSVPAQGFGKGIPHLGRGSLVWCAGCVVRFVVLMEEGGPPVYLLANILALLLLLAIGIVGFLVAYNAGQNRAIFDIVADGGTSPGPLLPMTRRSLFITRQEQWNRKDIIEITVHAGKFRMKSRGRRSQLRMVVSASDGPPHVVKLLTFRDELDLSFVAATLRQALGLNSPPPMRS
jgi:hypothetical protein